MLATPGDHGWLLIALTRIAIKALFFICIFVRSFAQENLDAAR
jgi:hypothetical protein